MLKNKLIISLIGIYIVWLFILPIIVTNVFTALCKNLSHNSQYTLSLETPRASFSILPTGTLNAKKIEIKAKNESFNLILNTPTLRLRLLPLLSGKIHINEFSVEKVDLVSNLVEDLELDKDFFENFDKFYLKVDSIKIGEFAASFYQKDIERPILYRGKGFVYERKNKYVRLCNDSTLNVDGNISKVVSNLYLPKNSDLKKTVFDLEILNIEIAPLRAYFKHYLPKDLEELRGEVNIRATKDGLVTELSNCAIIMKDDAQSIILPPKMFIKSKFNISRNLINFESVDIESDNIHASMDGKLYNYFGKTMPTVDFNIRMNKSQVLDIINLLPAFEIEEFDVYKLKKYKFYAETLANFRIKGRLPEPEVVGDVYIDDGVLKSPIPNTPKGATIKLNFAGKLVNFDVVVPVGDLQKVWVKGSQELYNTKFADLTVKSTDKVDLKVAQTVLVPLHEVLNFIIGPLPIMDINGNGNIDIRVKGNRKNPHIWGVFNANDSEACFNDVKELKVVDTDAVLNFDDQNVFFQSKKSILNGKEVFINGKSDVFGKFDFDIRSENQKLGALYRAIKDSSIVAGLPEVSDFEVINGLVDYTLKVYGDVKDINSLEFSKNVFAKGHLTLKDSKFNLQNLLVENASGNVEFNPENLSASLKAFVGDLPFNINANLNKAIADIVLDAPKFNLNILLSDEETRQKHYLPYVSILGKYKGSTESIDYNKLNFNATILNSVPNSKIVYQPGGSIKINNGNILMKDVRGYLVDKQNNFAIDANIQNSFSESPSVNGLFKLKTPDLSLFNEILSGDILPSFIKKYVENYKFEKGTLDFNAKVLNNKVSSNIDLANIEFIYLPFSMPVKIINGSLALKNNMMKLNKINFLADNMPLLADGEISNLFDNPSFNIYINSKPQQEFIDKYINKNQIYPIKIKGDIVYWVRLKGQPDNFDLKAEIDMSKDSSVYHFGATIGDIENAIEVSIDSKVNGGNKHKIREFSYDKIIESQSGRETRLNMLKAWGGVEILKEDLAFENLRIKTNHPTDARIFNIIFRKPNIKQGQFTSDLKLNGRLSDCKILGDFHIFETNIPFLDTSMKNIELLFKDKNIEFNSKGDIMGSDIVFKGTMKNKLSVPYKIEKAYLYAKDLNLNQLVDKLKQAEVDTVSTFESFEGFDISSIVAKNFKLKADTVQLRNIHAADFEALTSLSEKGVFDVNNFNFNIAQGTLGGKYSYNFKTNDMSVNLKAESISANDLSWALFDLNNQIYGNLTGRVDLTCNGSDFGHCMETLSGNTIFNVKDGKIPKLGSLEYLLKAGNLVKGGLTGLSINSVIDLISPSKTGDFDDIFGSVRIKDGIARNIEITTKGDDLSLFIGGTYNFATSIADMEVLGLLSRKISTMFGPIGNMSINTLFNVIPGVDLSKDSLVLERINKIPGIELSSKAYRKFIAEIKGNINGEDYVTSFKWIN